MLPDFYKAKKKLRDFVLTYIQVAKKQYLGFLADVPEARFFEGHQRIIETEDGIIDKGGFHKAQSQIRINLKDFHSFSSKDFMIKVNQIAEDMAREQSRIVFEGIEEITKKAGRNIDAKKKPLTVELYLEMLEGLFISFDSKGKPLLPQVVTGSKEIAKKFIEINKEIDTNLKYKKRYKEIIQKKKMEWDEREASRKLVG